MDFLLIIVKLLLGGSWFIFLMALYSNIYIKNYKYTIVSAASLGLVVFGLLPFVLLLIYCNDQLVLSGCPKFFSFIIPYAIFGIMVAIGVKIFRIKIMNRGDR